MDADLTQVNVALILDEPARRTSVSTWLRDEGFTVWAYPSADVALESMAVSGVPDVIVTGLFLPGIDGWRFCRLLKSAEFPDFNAVPVVVASVTYAGEDANQITRALGAERFLPLPMERREFVAAVREVITADHQAARARVLIVEDSISLLNALSHEFRNQGYETWTAGTGTAAKELLDTHRFDFVILDNHLPDTTGDEILVATVGDRPETAFIMITADSDPELALQWMLKGASGYVKKPFDPAYLIELCVKAGREKSLLRIEALLEERNRELAAGHERYKTLLKELQHRVKNSLSIITSLIGLEIRKDTSDATRTALGNLRARVRSIADLYSHLNESENTDTVALDHYLRTIAASMSSIVSVQADVLPVRVSAEPFDTSAQRAATIGLIATELVTNAFKYGETEQGGAVILLLLRLDERSVVLEVWNGGRTVPEGFNMTTATGSGLKLVRILADQLGGTITCESGDDTVFRLVFPR